MPTFLSDQMSGGLRPPLSGHSSGEVLSVLARVSLSAALAADDLIQFLKIPAGHVLLDALLVADDLDEGAALAFTLGALNEDGDGITASSELWTADDLGQAGGAERAVAAGLAAWDEHGEIFSREADVVLAAKITTAAATPVAGEMKLRVWYAAV